MFRKGCFSRRRRVHASFLPAGGEYLVVVVVGGLFDHLLCACCCSDDETETESLNLCISD